MRLLILPDIHNLINIADRVINKVPHDLALCLGDAFDNFGDNSADAARTAGWLKNFLTYGVFILGNHDLSYYCYVNYKQLWCPGFDLHKYSAVNKILSESDWRNCVLHYYLDNWLFTHAGFDERLLSNEVRKLALTSAIINNISALCKFALFTLQNPNGSNSYLPEPVQCLLNVGKDRGGDAPVGGITWSDFNSLIPVNGLNQCFGHTPDNYVRVKTSKDNHKAVCIDTHLKHFAILEDGNLTIHETNSL
jgi:hypothetical protein